MFETIEDEYLWSKNQNCIFQPRLVKNASARLGMYHLKTEGTLIKSVHCTGDQPEEFNPMNPYFANDLTPLTGYSLNKRNRWNIQNEVDAEMLETLQEFHENTPDEILFLDRVNLKTFEWKYLSFVHFPKDFLINSIHSLKKAHENEDGEYKFSKLNSIRGQNYSHFMDRNRKPEKSDDSKETETRTVVVYNFIRAPKNYLRLGEQHFVASNFGGRYPYYSYQKRKANWKEFIFDIKKSVWKYYNESCIVEDNEYDETSEKDGFDQDNHSKYYDLYNHLKDDFVFVKKRRN